MASIGTKTNLTASFLPIIPLIYSEMLLIAERASDKVEVYSRQYRYRLTWHRLVIEMNEHGDRADEVCLFTFADVIPGSAPDLLYLRVAF